ncbi:LysR family transcriptional regulator [Vreelandella alkaliphila]|uniref:LysR family transcriptional regulator n=2 Tax=Halomonas TaxID=2745 RepID=A0A3D0KD20_9GAMM|nr:LysR family transcriptional regulator [Halomonas sp. 3F2F]HBS84366.1 LysR family transcriptional regulator [Halomonas campaniensis]HCA01200.1 LysR family transcriptional regulator [Halomonas campaniensis]
MDRIRQMQIFIQVMESGNFTRAAEALAIPRSTVSTEIQVLEDRLQTQLLFRTTRKVAPTQDGRRFLETAQDIIDAVAASEQMFLQGNLRLSGRLRVDIPSRIARRLILPALPGFIDQHPSLAIDLSASDRMVDLIADGVDCVLRLGILEDSDLVCRPLGEVDFVTCASPEYLAHHGLPKKLNDLSSHLMVNYSTQLPASTATLEFQQSERLVEIEMRSAITVDGAEAYIAAALSGLGLIQVPTYDVRHLFERGELKEILPDTPPPSIPLSFLFAKRRNLSPKVRVFLHWLESILEGHGVISQSSTQRESTDKSA